MGLLGRDDILGADDIPYEVMACPEWGGDVRFRSVLTGAERAKVSRLITAVKGGQPSLRQDVLATLPETLVTLVAVDAEGERLFTDQDTAALAHKSTAPITRIFKAVMKASGLNEAAAEAIAGNSEATQSESSTSD